LRKLALLLFAAAATVCCRAQEQLAAPVASAPAAAPVQPDYPIQAHNFVTFVKRLYAVRAFTSTLPSAALDQVRVWPKQWGSDGNGFEKRLASRYGRYAIGVGFEETVKAIHYEDTRYRRLGQGSVVRRVEYAVVSTAVARRKDGSRTPAWSLAANAYGSSGVAILWMPRQYRTAASVAEWGSSSMGAFALSNLAREYWPDLKRMLRRKRTN
jgi:hypothetical protein